MSKSVDIYTIEKIQEGVKDGSIELPPIQRGFVWKPYQIENLWDSLLRGFPIGCFICKRNGEKIEILDGQQRLTSILLGLNWETENDSSKYAQRIIDMQKEMKIFLDIEENQQDEKDHRKYNTRVITKFHPWGYQKSQNYKILSFDDIRDAKQAIYNCIPDNKDKEKIKIIYDNEKIEDVYLDNKALQILFDYGFPYDGIKNKDDYILLKDSFKDEYKEKYFTYKNKEEKPISDFYKKILNTRVPFVFIDEDEGQTEYAPKDKTRENIDSDTDKDLDSTEYLFTLINRGGTRISNDDLNFSFIKSKLLEQKTDGRKDIEDINEACKNAGISPARFVMICYFLLNNSHSLYISPRSFKNALKTENKRDDFIKFLKGQIHWLENKKQIPLLNEAMDLMVYNANNKNGIPYIWFLDILQQNMYLTFLMCYLLKKRDEGKLKNIETYFIPIITIISVFGYQKYQQQTQKKLVESFVDKIEKENKVCDFKNILGDFFNDEECKKLMRIPLKPEEVIWKNEEFFEKDFGDYIKWEKNLLLYAQRKYLTERFKNEHFTLDDMNRPFDYDHIFPAKEGRWYNCKNWNTIGNYRAWPYGDNRRDQDDAPIIKFMLDKENEKEKQIALLENSFCSHFAAAFTKIGEDIKSNREEAEKIIRERIYLIYKEWYDDNFKILEDIITGNEE